jgi:CBS domain-containing protein
MDGYEATGNKTVGSIMTVTVATVAADASIADAVEVMKDNGIGSLVVLKDGSVDGILTETDLLRSVADGVSDDAKVADTMTSPIVTVEKNLPLLEASKLMEVHGFRRLPVVDEGNLIGIITETDITRAMESMGIWKKLENVMTTDVVTAHKEDTVVDAAKLMTANNIGCVVVTADGRVAGMLTEKDILVKVLGEKRNPASTLAAEVMGCPALTVNPDFSVYSASKLMQENGFRRLPVVDEGRLVGIVTQTDLTNVMRSVIIEVVPQLEAELKATPIEHDLEAGKSYLIEEKKPVKSYEIFVDMAKHGYMGLCISRTNPKKVRESYGLSTTPVVWVTDIKTDEQSIKPADLAGVSNLAGEFLNKVDKGVVFLEALTYLIGHNSFERVLHTIQHIRDITSESQSSLIIYIDPVVLTERELKLLMEEMDEVKFRAY